ncbi:MAG: M20/M25/M40 family metallo-hydrolase, partial [Myxococcales bacterium]|nr:M20/M25/M40 family metallo-hydrolase [Myxococcales bacterium]
AALTASDGRPAPHLFAGTRPLSESEREGLEGLPFEEETFKAQAGMRPGTELVGDPEAPVWARMWRQPAVTVVALEASPLEGSSNQIVDVARARVSVRIVPDQDPLQVQDALVRHFETHLPWGLELSVQREAVAKWWVTEPIGPAFDAAREAMQAGYGRKTEIIGCGGTIPFVEPFARVLGGIPAILMGLEDPLCRAHSENESLLVADFERGSRAAVHLYAGLADALR